MSNKIIFAPVFFLLFSCNLGSSFSDEFSADDGKEVLKVAKFDRVLIDSTGEMQVFASMNKTDELNDKADLQFMDGFKEIYLLVLKEPIADFEYSLNYEPTAYMQNVRDSSSAFAIYSEFIANKIKGSITSGVDSIVAQRSIGDMKFRIYHIEGVVKNIKFYYQVGLVQGKQNFYQVITWTLAKRKNLYEGVMKKMIESVEEY